MNPCPNCGDVMNDNRTDDAVMPDVAMLVPLPLNDDPPATTTSVGVSHLPSSVDEPEPLARALCHASMTLVRSNTDQSVTCPRCPTCGRVCRTWQGLSSHERHKHDDGGCPICYGGTGQACWSHFL